MERCIKQFTLTTPHMMKKIIASIFLALSFVVSAQNANTAYGTNALQSNTTGNNNTAMGQGAMYSNTTGDYNTALGKDALYSNTTGNDNTALGQVALYSNTTGNFNTALGENALYTNSTGNDNTALGFGALFSNTTGKENTALGRGALYENTEGEYNTALGRGALSYNTTGNNNTALGHEALNNNTTGNFNTAMGKQAMVFNTTGYWNMALGYGALYTNTVGYHNTALGVSALASSATAINQTIIGYNADGQADNSVTLGNSDVTAVYMAEDKGATVYAAGLDLNSFSITATSTVLTLAGDLTINSDARLKDNIQPLGSTLDKLHQIEGKTYTFLKDEEHTPKIGVLAQEVQAVFPELVTEGADGILSVNYQGLVPVLINAINEQEAKIAALEAQNEQLAIASQKIAALEEMVRFLAVQQSQATSSVASN